MSNANDNDANENDVAMNDARQRAELFHKLANFARDRFQFQQNLEWKISFALWTALAAGIALVLSDNWSPGYPGVWIIALIVVVGWHWTVWLPMMDRASKRDQRVYYYWETHVEDTLGVQRPEWLEPRSNWPTSRNDGDKDPDKEWIQASGWSLAFLKLHRTHQMQGLVTLLLAVLFIVVVLGKQSGPIGGPETSVEVTGELHLTPKGPKP